MPVAYVRSGGDKIMLYAVTIEPLNAVFFVSEKPLGAGWDVQDGVGLDVPSNFDAWPEGAKRPEQILCAAVSDPLHYKIFKHSSDIDLSEYRPTGKHFGGVYSRSSWARFFEHLPAALDVVNVPDREPPGATDEAVAAIKQRN
jgi:hypothetical protein